VPDRFMATPLRADQVDQAWPLVNAILPKVSLDDWRRYASDWQTETAVSEPSGSVTLFESANGLGLQVATSVPEAGIMTLQEAGYIQAMFRYTVSDTLAHGRTLLVDEVLLLTPFHQNATDKAFSLAVEGLAERLACRSVHLLLTAAAQPNAVPSASSDGLHRAFTNAGYQREGVWLCRPERSRSTEGSTMIM